MVGRGATMRRAQARQDMREAIVNTARTMVAAEGVANLSLRAIARELGYSPAALYEYFESKEDIARCLYFDGSDGLTGRMLRTLEMLPPATPPIEAKKALGRAYRGFALEQRELFLLIFGSGGTFSKLSDDLDRGPSAYDALLSTVQGGIDAGDFVPLPAQALALTSWAAVHGFVMLELSGAFHADALDCEQPMDYIATDELFETHMELTDQGIRRR